MGSLPPTGRPRPGASVTLRPITAETVGAVCALAPQPHQTRMVAPNAVSLAQALFEPTAWYRAIYADETLVGFVMVEDNAAAQEYGLWRLMIAGEYQGLGFGRRALDLVVEYVRTRPGASELLTSYVPGPGSPGDFYLKCGFGATGEVDDDGEVILRLPLRATGHHPKGRAPDGESDRCDPVRSDPRPASLVQSDASLP